MDKKSTPTETPVSPITLNQKVLSIMANGPESDRVFCPICASKKETNHLVCPTCKGKPGAFEAVKKELSKLRGQHYRPAVRREVRRRPEISRGTKVQMVEYAIEAIQKGIDSGTLPEVMAQTSFPRIPILDRQRAVADAVSAIGIADSIQAYASASGVGFEDVDKLVDSFISARANGVLSSFVCKAAIFCIIQPRLKKIDAFEEKVDAAVSDLEGMGLSEAYNTSLVKVRDALVERFGGSSSSRGFKDFCFAAAREALERFKKGHEAEWRELVEKNTRIAKERLQHRFQGKGYIVKKAKVA